MATYTFTAEYDGQPLTVTLDGASLPPRDALPRLWHTLVASPQASTPDATAEARRWRLAPGATALLTAPEAAIDYRPALEAVLGRTEAARRYPHPTGPLPPAAPGYGYDDGIRRQGGRSPEVDDQALGDAAPRPPEVAPPMDYRGALEMVLGQAETARLADTLFPDTPEVDYRPALEAVLGTAETARLADTLFPTTTATAPDPDEFMARPLRPRQLPPMETTTPDALHQQAEGSDASGVAIADASRLIAFEAQQRQRAGLPATQPASTPEMGTSEDLRRLAGLGLGMALPAGGAALGARVLPQLPRLAAALGEMAGSYGARRANVALGAEAPGLAGDVASVAIPGVARAYSPIKESIVSRLPGGNAAVRGAQDAALRQAQTLPATLQPSPTATSLYGVAGQQPPVQMHVLRRQAHAARQGQAPAVQALTEDIAQLLRDHGGRLPLDVLRQVQMEIHQQALQAAGPVRQALRQARGAIFDDLDQAARQAGPGAARLRQANQAARQEAALEELTQLFSPGQPGIVVGKDGALVLDGPRLRQAFASTLEPWAQFHKAFGPEQLHAIKQTFAAMARLPKVAPRVASGAVTPATSAAAHLLRSLWPGATAGALAQVLTGNPESAVQVGAGAVVAQGLAHVVALALTSAPGRKALLTILRQHGELSPGLLGLSLTLGQQGPGGEVGE